MQSWDTASKTGEANDYSACTTWLIQERKYYLVHVLRERLDYPELKKRAIAHARAYNAQKIYVEDTGVGTGLIGEMKAAGLTVIAIRPERDKKTRMSIQSAKFESGLVLLPKQASWLAGYERNCSPSRTLHMMIRSTAPLRLWPWTMSPSTWRRPTRAGTNSSLLLHLTECSNDDD